MIYKSFVEGNCRNIQQNFPRELNYSNNNVRSSPMSNRSIEEDHYSHHITAEIVRHKIEVNDMHTFNFLLYHLMEINVT